jgi:sensor histidine kinase regulating citrate/malate metabolism
MSVFSKHIDKKIAAYQRELIETHYAEVENMYKQIRGWRHDYRNHIQTMKAYAASGDMYAIKTYLDELDTDLSTVDTVIKTGNAMADAILNSKISLAKSKHISVQADAHIPLALTISELDLCVIIGNLFDNAIEASMNLPEGGRMIRIYMDMKGTQLYISFTNFTSSKKLTKINGIFQSTKGEGHGFGLVRIDNIIERLDGYISRNSEDGAFTTEILLPQDTNSSPDLGNSSPK